MSKVDIKKYAGLARIALADEEAQSLEKDIEGILGYVDQVRDAQVDSLGHSEGDTSSYEEEVHNVLRDDECPHEPGIYTEVLMEAAPLTVEKNGGTWVKVKKIL